MFTRLRSQKLFVFNRSVSLCVCVSKVLTIRIVFLYLCVMFSSEIEHGIHELEFLEEDRSFDETDGLSAAVIALEKDSETLAKYVKRKTNLPPYYCKPTVERNLRLEKVSPSWGRHNHVKSSASLTNGIPALLSFDVGETSCVKHIDDHTIDKFLKALCKVSREDCFEVLKYNKLDNLQTLVNFEGTKAYQEFGKRFINGEVEEISGFKLIEVKAVSLAYQYPCHLEITCSPSEGAKLKADLSSFFVSYCSRFPCISLQETAQKAVRSISSANSSASGETVPAVSLMMRFMSKAQRNAQKFIQAVKMSKYDWHEFSLPEELSEMGQTFFKSSKIPGISISVQQGSPYAGIKIMLFVNKNLDEMEKFYTFLSGKSPLAVDQEEEGLRYRTYPLSAKLELQLVLHTKLKSSISKDVQLCFLLNDESKDLAGMPGGASDIGEKHWQVTDPDGNSLLLYSLLK